MDTSANYTTYTHPRMIFCQANVYHALTPERRHLALKIYKTSILVFKDRDKYVSGEYRFRKGYRYPIVSINTL